MNNSDTYQMLKARYTQVRSQLGITIDAIASYHYSIMESLMLNSYYWYSDFCAREDSPYYGMVDGPEKLVEDNILFLYKFLLHRKEYFDTIWKN